MQITELKVRLWNDQRLRALVTVVFDRCFVVRNIKVIEGRDGRLFVAMPSRKLNDGTFVDIAHPINKEFRGYIQETILESFEDELQRYERDPDAYRRERERVESDGEDPTDWSPTP